MNFNIQNFSKILEDLYSEYLLINRIMFKVKNQFRRQKQFKYLHEIKKKIKSYFFKKGELTFNMSEYITHFKLEINESMLKELNEKVDILGEHIKEMLKLKLYLSYSVIILGILSRIKIYINNIISHKILIY